MLKFLAHCHQLRGPLGRTFQLGRQGIYLDPRHVEIADSIVREHEIGADFRSIGGAEPYSENLFKSFGASEVVSCDASAYEGAHLLHDFNNPVPSNWHGSFDTVFDGGSLEHIFNIPVALANLMQLTRVGGRVLSVNSANDFLGHGLYQFSPDLMFRVFSESNGFRMLGAFLVRLNGTPTLDAVADPLQCGERIEIGDTGGNTYLMFVAEKIAQFQPFQSWPQQSDYTLIWKKN
ncbi:hypothetical protein [Bradyrhizobium sp. 33ap4]|uniref:hypothetical protein n=1 Tax=Bradyrhizobium sp. 33ap4 TaxID=3061630 RepID=UPI0029307574|nr:hypothetical protein [Bradyrhizobium sp. 33ap4]